MNNETNYCGERKSCQKGDCKGCLLRGIEEPKLGEECGVFGMYGITALSKNKQKKRQHISVLSLNTGFRSCTGICKNCFPI